MDRELKEWTVPWSFDWPLNQRPVSDNEDGDKPEAAGREGSERLGPSLRLIYLVQMRHFFTILT